MPYTVIESLNCSVFDRRNEDMFSRRILDKILLYMNPKYRS